MSDYIQRFDALIQQRDAFLAALVEECDLPRCACGLCPETAKVVITIGVGDTMPERRYPLCYHHYEQLRRIAEQFERYECDGKALAGKVEEEDG